MHRKEIIKFIILRTVGNFLVLFAVYGILATFGPALYYEANYRILAARGVTFTIEEPQARAQDEPLAIPTSSPSQAQGIDNFADVLIGAREQVLTAPDPDFSIVIPKIGAAAKVIANVDPSNEEEYQKVLLEGVAHAKGTVFPGIRGNTYLFAHSTDSFWDVGRYNAVFYLLKDLAIGDEVTIFYQGIRHDYVITESKIVGPNDVSPIIDAQKKGEETLILQTCWPPGTTFQRLLVFARPK